MQASIAAEIPDRNRRRALQLDTMQGHPLRLGQGRLQAKLPMGYGINELSHNLIKPVIIPWQWGRDASDEVDYLKAFIYRLRRKIEPDLAQPRYLLTERGVGYWLDNGENLNQSH